MLTSLANLSLDMKRCNDVSETFNEYMEIMTMERKKRVFDKQPQVTGCKHKAPTRLSHVVTQKQTSIEGKPK